MKRFIKLDPGRSGQAPDQLGATMGDLKLDWINATSAICRLTKCRGAVFRVSE